MAILKEPKLPSLPSWALIMGWILAFWFFEFLAADTPAEQPLAIVALLELVACLILVVRNVRAKKSSRSPPGKWSRIFVALVEAFLCVWFLSGIGTVLVWVWQIDVRLPQAVERFVLEAMGKAASSHPVLFWLAFSFFTLLGVVGAFGRIRFALREIPRGGGQIPSSAVDQAIPRHKSRWRSQ